MKKVLTIGAIMLLAFLGACAGNNVKPAVPAAAADAVELPAGIIVSERPADEMPLAEAKKKAKRGETIVVRGVVRGINTAFVPGRAMMQIADESVPKCPMHPDRPWDLHCETPESMAANTATVQIADANGKPLKLNLQGKQGLDHQALVVVKGTVSVADERGNFVLDAMQIYIGKRKD
jgi:hypothetical protein